MLELGGAKFAVVNMLKWKFFFLLVLLFFPTVQAFSVDDIYVIKDGEELRIGYFGGQNTWINFNFTFNYFNGNVYTPAQLKQADPNVNFSIQFSTKPEKKKFDIVIDTPPEYVGKYNITMCAASHSPNVEWSDFKRKGATFLFKNRVAINLFDIKKDFGLKMVSPRCGLITDIHTNNVVIDPEVYVGNENETIGILVSTSVTGAEEELQRGGTWAGHIIDTRKNCSTIGRLEKDIKRFVCIETYEYLYNEYFKDSLLNDSEEKVQERKFYLPLSSIFSEQERNILESIEYNQKLSTYNASIQSLYLTNVSDPSSYKTRFFENITELVTLLDWDTKENASRIHGSGGEFTCCGPNDDYQTIVAWEAAENSDLTSEGINATLHIVNPVTETSPFSIDGWTADAGSMPIVINHVGPHGAKWNEDGHKIVLDGSGEIDWDEAWGLADGIQVRTTYRRGFRYTPLTERGNFTIKNSIIIKNNSYGTGGTLDVDGDGTDNNIIYAYNNVFATLEANGGYGIINNDNAKGYFYGNIITGGGICGFTSTDGHGVFKNNLLYNCTTDWTLNNEGQGDYNTIWGSSFPAGSHFTNEWDLSNNDSSDLFVDKPNLDFSIVPTSTLLDVGYDLREDGNLTFIHDIENDMRPSGEGYDLGADENATNVWMGDWDKRIKVTAESDEFNVNLDHFPLAIELNSTQGSEVFTEVSNDYKKIAVTKVDGRSNLSVEVARWDDSETYAEIYVSNPYWRLKSYEDTEFYIYYDSTKSDNPNIGVSGDATAAKVWDDNYKLVLHFNGTTQGEMVDSTENNHDISGSSGTPTYGVDSFLGKSVSFGGLDFLTIGDHADWDFGGSDDLFTIELFLNFSSYPASGDFPHFISHGSADGNADDMWSFRKDNSGFYTQFYANTGGATQHQVVVTTQFSTDWQYLSVKHLQDDLFVHHVNATITGSGTDSGSIGNYPDELEIGGNSIGTTRNVDGALDEIRISHVARSNDWMNVTYKAIIGDLLTFGEEEVYGEVAVDPCTYPGSGDWTINGSQHCVITEDQDLSGNKLFVVGGGTLTISGAKIRNFGDVSIRGHGPDTVHSLCYQDTANQSTACGGLSTGNYSQVGSFGWNDFENIVDADFSTSSFTLGTAGSGTSYLYANYTKPLYALNTSLWLVKDEGSMVNLSIPGGCWNQTPLQFRVRSVLADPSQEAYWDCRNEAGFTNLRTYGSSRNIYEEAMWWNISAGKLFVYCLGGGCFQD